MKHRVQLAVVALLLVGACASRQAILDRTLMGLDAADKAWAAFDTAKLAQINAEATSADEGRKAIFAWYAKTKHIPVGFAAAYGALSVAAFNPSDDALVTQAVTLASSLIDTLRQLGVFSTGGSP